uniref:hypothetical protein n=1 Tax=Pseudomonadati TaxID=3379134 RepID=UPI004048919F
MQWFKIELLSNVIVSERTATAGDHRSLDYIPATAIQGVLAGRAYRNMAKAEADQLILLQGALISDALPMLGNDIGLPVPLAWHTDKAEQIKNVFIPSMLTQEELARSQPQQIRQGYVTHNNVSFKPKMSRHTKTAINPDTGTVTSGQLFNYQSIASGQCYLFAVETSQGNEKKVKELLEGNASIGRSRSAEFGMVRISAYAAPKLPDCGQSNTILLVSDSQNIDSMGQPSGNPSHLGFGDVNLKQSYIRTRNRTRYNQFFRSYLADEQLIEAGSCLTLNDNLNLNPGLQWQHGCLVLAGCNWLSTSQHDLKSELSDCDSKKQIKESPLTLLLKQRLQPKENISLALTSAEKLYRSYVLDLYKAESYLGELTDNAPGKSQFGELRQWAQDGNTKSQVKDRLVKTQNKKNAWGWSLPVSPNETLAETFIELFSDIPEEQFAQVLERFAQKCARKSLSEMLADAETQLKKEAEHA